MTATINRVECVSEGGFEFARILVDGNRVTPDRSLEVWNHSPTGFAWGYLGSGPAQLALAVLLACGVSEDDAVRTHQTFKEQYIATVDQDRDNWSFELDVREWVEKTLYQRGELE